MQASAQAFVTEKSETPIKLAPEPESFEAVNEVQDNLQSMLKKELESFEDDGTDEELEIEPPRQHLFV